MPTMGCGASKLSDSPASAHGALITLTPDKWVKQLGLPLDASTATLGWCKELGATTMGDLALVGDLKLMRVASELAEIPQAKLTRALSELAAAIHEDEGTWPAWGVEGKVDLEPLPELETTGKEEELLLPPEEATGRGPAASATDFAAPQGEEKEEEEDTGAHLLQQLLQNLGLSASTATAVAAELRVSADTLQKLVEQHGRDSPGAVLAAVLDSADDHVVQTVRTSSTWLQPEF